MASITCYGVPGTLQEAQWSQLIGLVQKGGQQQIVDSGWSPSSSGTRTINLTAGTAAAVGVLAVGVGSNSVALDAGVTNPRIDVVCLQINTAGTASGAGTIVAVKGSPGATPTVPALTQNPGGVWQIPLAQVYVRVGVGTIASSDVTDIRPLRPSPQAYEGALSTTAIGHAASETTISTLQIPDPGWPYVLTCSAAVEFTDTSAGRGYITVYINGNVLCGAWSGDMCGATAVTRTKSSAAHTGPSTVTLTATPNGLATADTLVPQTVGGGLSVTLIPD